MREPSAHRSHRVATAALFLGLIAASFGTGSMPLAMPAHAAEVFVAPTGNDAADGSTEKPLATRMTDKDDYAAEKTPTAVPPTASLALAKDGKTEYVIFTAAQPIAAEETAAKELAEYLKKVTGAEFKTVTATAAEKPAKAIYLGWTAFAAEKGIDGAALGREEWVIKTVGDSLVITGGRPRGTLYGVYDFLEKELGVYWLDRDTEVVPPKSEVALKPLDRRARPAIGMRNLYTAFFEAGWGWPGPTGVKERPFRNRNRQNNFGYGGPEMRPYGGGAARPAAAR